MAEAAMADRNEGQLVPVENEQQLARVEQFPVQRSALAALSAVEFELVLQDIKLEQERFDRIVANAMTEGIDYGKLPGMKQDMLYAEGAGVLMRLFHLRPEYEREHIWGDGATRPVYTCVSTCHLVDMRTEKRVFSAGAVASTHETKYRWRNAKAECPDCGKPAIQRSKFPPRNQPDAEPGFWCNSTKLDGCGHNFAADDQRILEQALGKIENPDPGDIFEAVMQMADKRAQVMAVRRRTGASRRFGQDEDVIRSMDGTAEDATRSEASPRTATSAPPAATAATTTKTKSTRQPWSPPEEQLFFFRTLLAATHAGKGVFTERDKHNAQDWLDGLFVGDSVTEEQVLAHWHRAIKQYVEMWNRLTNCAHVPGLMIPSGLEFVRKLGIGEATTPTPTSEEDDLPF